MADAKPTPFATGALTGTLYNFARKGDKLARHTHETPEAMHVTFCMSGTVVVREFDGDRVEDEHVLSPGDWLDGDAPMDHEIEALHDGARILNVIKGS